ncbi:RNA ligase family protein [Streptomyces sp. SP18BB07]|uniref:RNA ligase family protein n=1 Tax=Streptomyces sp. SP18BB07 TaxID=3002522 RepID=UPI002E79B78E|nr:RNA ligase family protein [Streptomyces sp. SP18BB07]MEE1759086.1 RNA ligase family protein [Streptomyces sp. SP18BB07]
MRTHYPRTRHLPWSPGATADDLRVTDLSGLRGREVVVTEKLDGENTTLYRDGVHARSLDSAHHPSRTWVKALQARIGHAVPPGWRVCGENMFARHSLAYDDLDSWFYGFSVWDADGRCLGWDRTVELLRGLGIPVPRVLWRGVFDERALRALRLDLGRQEGYVVRVVDGFAADEFGTRVAKWVRAGHVRTDTHWMHAAVVENGLGARAPLWAVRSGAPVDADTLAEAVGLPGQGDREAVARFDAEGRTGDERLAGALAALLHEHAPGGRRARVAARLAGAVGMPLARRVADLVGLHSALHRPYPDEDRPTGLARLSLAADLGLLHAVARATAATDEAREQVEWSALHAEEVPGLDEEALAEAFAELPPEAAVRCRAEAREAYARGRIGGGGFVGGGGGSAGGGGGSTGEAVAATWRWRSGAFPRLVQLVGPAGSGKSTFARGLTGVDAYVSLDDLREARGDRADQRANADVLRAGLHRLDGALAAGGTTVWDATCLTHQQRSLVHAVAHRRDALVTHAVVLVDEDELVRRNGRREHPVPPDVLTAQLRRFAPPYPGDAHRTWYVGASGTMEDEH